MYANGEGVPENDKTAVMWYTKAAEQGYADAQFKLGLMYGNGEGVPENDKTAMIWFTKAAEQGYADAQLYLGLMSHSSQPVDGFPKNNKTAAMWLAKAAEQGDARAQFFLGYIYATGEGVPENDIKAYAWSSMAKANGYNIDGAAKIIKERMTKEQIAKAQDLAAKCYASDYKDCD